MTIGRKVYSKEFKLEAIKTVLDQGINSTEVGRQLGVDGSSVRNWIKIYSDKKDE
jgi:transposase-like protein